MNGTSCKNWTNPLLTHHFAGASMCFLGKDFPKLLIQINRPCTSLVGYAYMLPRKYLYLLRNDVPKLLCVCWVSKTYWPLAWKTSTNTGYVQIFARASLYLTQGRLSEITWSYAGKDGKSWNHHMFQYVHHGMERWKDFKSCILYNYTRMNMCTL